MSANYCTHFRPARGAFSDRVDPSRNRAREDLAELFGLDPGSQQSTAESSRKVAASARRELDALFGIESESGAEPIPADSEDRGR